MTAMDSSKWNSMGGALLALLAAASFTSNILHPVAATPQGGITFTPEFLVAEELASVEVEFASSRIDFDSNASYSLVLQQANGLAVGSPTMFMCTFAFAKRLRCDVTWVSPGFVLVVLRNGLVDVYTSVLYVGFAPIVTRIIPSELSRSAGQALKVFFMQPLVNHGQVVARFHHDATGQYADAALIVASNSRSASGRSPKVTFGDSSIITVRVLLSLNNHNFLDTGKAVRFKKKAPLLIGFMYSSDPSDFGWTFQHNIARLDLEKRFVGQVQTRYQSYVPVEGPNVCDFCHEEPGWNASKRRGRWNDEPEDFFGTHQCSMVIKKWVEDEGMNMVIATSFFYQWDVFHMAKRYPQIPFIHVGGWLTRENMAQVFPKIYQGRYLTGIAMAWYIKKHNLPKRVGYVSSFRLGETVRGINAFKLGMNQVDTDIDVYLIWLSTWHDARKERVGTRRLIEFYGVEGIAQHTDSREPQIVARDLGKVGVGYNTDMSLSVGDSVLTSPVLVWGPDYGTLVQRVLDGETLANDNLWLGLETGSWRISDLSQRVPTEASVQIEEEHAKLRRGEDKIFCQPGLRDQRGRLRNGPDYPQHVVPGTTCLTDSAVKNSNWLVQGVYDDCAPSALKPEGITSANLTNGECFLGVMKIPDECPVGQHLTLWGCVEARPGYYSVGEKEIPCPVGYRAGSPGAFRCDPCEAGSAAFGTATETCTACLPGHFAEDFGKSECMPCPKGTATEKHGAATCELCALGFYAEIAGLPKCKACPNTRTTKFMSSTDSSHCICDEGFYLPIGSITCATCPEGMYCEVGSTEENIRHHRNGTGSSRSPAPVLLKRYWSSAAEPLNVFACTSSHQCTGGPPGDACAPKLTNRACAHCEIGYHWNGMECEECTSVDASLLLFPMVPIILCPFVIFVLYRLFRDNVHKWGSWRNGVTSVAFIMLKHFQFIDLLRTVDLDISNLSSIKLWAFTNNILLLFHIDCTGYGDFGSVLVARVILPLLLGSSAAALFFCSRVVARVLERDELSMNGNRLNNALFSVVFTFFSAIVALSLSLFKCLLNPNGMFTLIEDRSIVCYTDEKWEALLGIQFMAVLFYIFGFGGMLIRVIVVAPKRFSDAGFQMRWKFLFIKFRPELWWWSVLIVATNSLSGFGFVIFQYPIHQLYWVTGVIAVYQGLTATLLPYRHRVANVFEGLMCTLVVVTAAAMVGAADVNALDAVPLINLFTPIGLGGLCAAYLVRRVLLSRRLLETSRRERLMSDVHKCASALTNMDTQSKLSFYAGLCDTDRWSMRAFTHVVLAEATGMMPQRRRIFANLLAEVGNTTSKTESSKTEFGQGIRAVAMCADAHDTADVLDPKLHWSFCDEEEALAPVRTMVGAQTRVPKRQSTVGDTNGSA
eukprot:TRINITY_DN20763_c0_g1_i1.p1 TRINITY_DN20763_c0_g1~~TRINITY_DN20763_c0_g1_i1.p1  ORF type:complete len:1386 (+),score=171.53 TRINITY_DN20763_c0_g1_i1:50-4207(+)